MNETNEKVIKIVKVIAILIIIIAIAFIISLAIKALGYDNINFEDLNGKVFISGDSYLKINANSVIIDRTSYDIKSVDNDIIIVNLNENETFIIKIIDESTIFCELGRRYYHEQD